MGDIILKTTDYAKVIQQTVDNDYQLLTIEHPLCKASVSLYGGHVLTWQPTNEKPVLWLSKTAEFKSGKAIRGGIPICWPWFGPLLDTHGNNLGNHGFARTNMWQLKAIDITPDEVSIVLFFNGENKHSAWQHAFVVEQTLVFSTSLSQKLSIENHSNEAIFFGQALHSYFAVSDPKNVRVPHLDDVPFDDKVTGEKQQLDRLKNCAGPIDRIYHNNNEQIIEDKGWQRTIKVSSNNCHQWVLWNPGKGIASTMADIHEQGENEYVCLEAANTSWQTIDTGKVKVLSQRVDVI